MQSQSGVTILQSLTRVWKRDKRWIWKDVMIPLVVTRIALLVAGWFSKYLPLNMGYPIREVVERGWHFSPHRVLDVWGRWDTGWYLSIVKNGYIVGGDIQTTQSNIAFFPLYPYLVRFFSLFVPDKVQTTGVLLLIGIAISNLFLLGALILLYKLIVSTLHDEEMARYSIAYLLLFPTSFFFSCFYTESAFLFFSVAAFYAASKGVWTTAGIAGFLLALTRPNGAIIAIPLGLMYLESLHWDMRKTRWGVVAWLLLVPVGLFVFLVGVYDLSGNLLAPIQIQNAWGKEFAMPWETLIHPSGFNGQVTQVDQLLTLGFLVLTAVSLFKLPSVSYGVYSYLLIIPPLVSGTLASMSRYCAVVFPVFIVLALLTEHRVIRESIAITFFVLQMLFMAAWSQFYTII